MRFEGSRGNDLGSDWMNCGLNLLEAINGLEAVAVYISVVRKVVQRRVLHFHLHQGGEGLAAKALGNW